MSSATPANLRCSRMNRKSRSSSSSPVDRPVKIEQPRFDRTAVPLERRLRPDRGEPAIIAPVVAGRNRVDAVLRHELLRRDGEIRRRETQDRGRDPRRGRRGPRSVYGAPSRLFGEGRDRPRRSRRGSACSRCARRSNISGATACNATPCAASTSRASGRIAGAARAEAKVLAEDERARAQASDDRLLEKRARVDLGETLVERDEIELVDAGRREQVDALFAAS